MVHTTAGSSSWSDRNTSESLMKDRSSKFAIRAKPEWSKRKQGDQKWAPNCKRSLRFNWQTPKWLMFYQSMTGVRSPNLFGETNPKISVGISGALCNLSARISRSALECWASKDSVLNFWFRRFLQPNDLMLWFSVERHTENVIITSSFVASLFSFRPFWFAPYSKFWASIPHKRLRSVLVRSARGAGSSMRHALLPPLSVI